MQSLRFPLKSPAEAGPLTPASQLRSRFSAPDPALIDRLAESYGRCPMLLADRARAAVCALDRFLETFGDLPCVLYRAPARISLNPHSDHQGAWVPYGLHSRELLAVVAPTEDDRVEVTNVDRAYSASLSFHVDAEARRDPAAWDMLQFLGWGLGTTPEREETRQDPAVWNRTWLSYIESSPVVEEVRRNLDSKTQTRDRRGTINYIKAGALRLRYAYPASVLPGLRMTLCGNIASGGGQSSSSALVVTTMLALAQLGQLDFHPKLDRRLLAELAGEAEWYVGTRGGSGDQAAILLGVRGGLTHLCFRAPFGIRGVRHTAFPAGYQLIVANSQTRSEKSAEERLMFNRGIFAYRFAFLALKEAMRSLGLPEVGIAETLSLGDLHTGRIRAVDLYRLVLALPESITPAELAARFPTAFGAAARGCFGTDDLAALPAEIPLRGAAVYGLGRVDRGLAMPGLLEAGDEGSMRDFGRLMSVTHDGDRLFSGNGAYTENKERLADGRLKKALAGVEAGDERPLRDEPGFYGASILELDRMVDVAHRTDGVLGAGLMGAGGGGYVLILAREGALEAVRETLVREYYRPLEKEPDVEAWHPTAAACRLS